MAWNYYKWGTMDIHTSKGSYSRPIASSNGLTELTILPDPELPDDPITILQQAGRGRKVANWRGYASESDYDSLVADFELVVRRTFSDPNGNTLDAYIEQLSGTKDGEYYNYNITIKEA